MSASTKALEDLHAAIAGKLTDAIDEMSSESKGLASLLNVARQFVKDNGIEALPTDGSPLGGLKDKLKEFPFQPNTDSVQ